MTVAADRRALARCLKLIENHPTDLGGRRQMREKKFDREPWEERASFACLVAQQELLRLRPWECCPAFSDPDPNDTDSWGQQKAKARVVADRLRALEISIYVADPLAEIAKAEESLRRQAPAVRVVSPAEDSITVMERPDEDPPAAA